ncbi:MAG: protein phosphatase 2C domain-containing protein [Gammaproteobacteria bacterium]
MKPSGNRSPVPATCFTWRSASLTSQGNVRAHNEDAVLELPAAGLWVVADGMGGHNAGDVASNAIVAALSSMVRHARPSVTLEEVEDRLNGVNEQLYRASLEEGGGVSGSTVAVLIALERHVLSVWAGDSRVYRCRDGRLTQITSDHSETQEMVAGGLMSPDEAETSESSNVITRAVGGAAELFLDLALTELRDGDQFLICTDGLYRALPKHILQRLVADVEPRVICEALIRQALAGVCRDNATAIVVQFSGS